MLELKSGDELHFNCHITFTDARAAEVGLPKTAQEIGTLTFANEAYTALHALECAHRASGRVAHAGALVDAAARAALIRAAEPA